MTSYEQLITPAVHALAIGLGEALTEDNICQGDTINCPAIRTDASLEKIVERTKNVKLVREVGESATRVFTDRGDGNLNYRISNLEPDLDTNNQFLFTQVGSFSPLSGLSLSPEDVVFYAK